MTLDSSVCVSDVIVVVEYVKEAFCFQLLFKEAVNDAVNRFIHHRQSADISSAVSGHFTLCSINSAASEH